MHEKTVAFVYLQLNWLSPVEHNRQAESEECFPKPFLRSFVSRHGQTTVCRHGTKHLVAMHIL
jgi:hypothetical protein